MIYLEGKAGVCVWEAGKGRIRYRNERRGRVAGRGEEKGRLEIRRRGGWYAEGGEGEDGMQG